jgi:hypothetical protein
MSVGEGLGPLFGGRSHASARVGIFGCTPGCLVVSLLVTALLTILLNVVFRAL